MKLYEIDSAISEVLALLEPDPVTGQIPDNWEEMAQKLDELGLQRQQKLEGVARYVLNVRSDIVSLKAEEDRLSKRRKVLENKESSLVGYLDHACQGQKTNLGVATVSYRKSEKVVVSDEGTARKFLVDNHHMDCLRIFEPEIAKSEVKALIKSGVAVPGVSVQESFFCSLR